MIQMNAPLLFKQAEGGMIQIDSLTPHLSTQAEGGYGYIFGRDDAAWGVEWWGAGFINFYVRGSGGGVDFRAIQADITNSGDVATGEDGSSGGGARWIRVAVSYNVRRLSVLLLFLIFALCTFSPFSVTGGRVHG
jgi:hypothetical protein